MIYLSLSFNNCNQLEDKDYFGDYLAIAYSIRRFEILYIVLITHCRLIKWDLTYRNNDVSTWLTAIYVRSAKSKKQQSNQQYVLVLEICLSFMPLILNAKIVFKFNGKRKNAWLLGPTWGIPNSYFMSSAESLATEINK